MKNRFLPCFALGLLLQNALPSLVEAQSAATNDSQPLKSFTGVARLHKLSATQKNLEATAYYPVFRAGTRLTRYVNTEMRRRTTSDYKFWLRESRQTLKTPTDFPAAFSYEVTPRLLRFRPANLVALSVDIYQFTGGAHGMGGTFPANFGIVNGRPKLLVLGDFFRAGTPYRAQTEAKILAKLRKDPNASWVQDKSVKMLTTAQFNNFEVHGDGLKWIFNAYEMGPYSAGQFEIKLSIAELGPDFRRERLK